MLAKEYEHHQKKVQFPCYVQPKVDGVRCITDGHYFWSKNGKLFPQENFEHLRVRGLKHLIDGELALSDGHEHFEEIVSVVKRGAHPNSKFLCFNAFDIITPEPYVVRKAQLQHVFERSLVKNVSRQWSRLTTKKALTIEHLYYYYDEFLDRGYEGLMIRSAMGLYVSKRTSDLLKWKPLHEKEFLIVGVREAKGKDRGTPIFVCATDPIVTEIEDGDVQEDWSEFRVRPMGTLEQRQQMWRDRRQIIGKQLTVEYQNLTKYGVPRFPRAKVLRDYE